MFDSLTDETAESLKRRRETAFFSDHACSDSIRRSGEKRFTLGSPFAYDTDMIVGCPYFNRYADKTQVFSLIRNDDITRRSLHVRLVERTARRIGAALGLNTDLIEAIALGHDIGHPPFAHAGEKFLDSICYDRTGKHFSHAIHSVRVLDKIFCYDLSLQVLSGIAAHNVKLTDPVMNPSKVADFDSFDRIIEECGEDRSLVSRILPSTLEAYVVRLSDIVSYIGRDRYDTSMVGFGGEVSFSDSYIGLTEAEIVNNISVNIIENSLGKPYICLDKEYFDAIKCARSENYVKIYDRVTESAHFEFSVKPMMEDIYEKLSDDMRRGRYDSPIFSHHIDYMHSISRDRREPYGNDGVDITVTDYIASMTDDYFVDIYRELFPDGRYAVNYIGYFD